MDLGSTDSSSTSLLINHQAETSSTPSESHLHFRNLRAWVGSGKSTRKCGGAFGSDENEKPVLQGVVGGVGPGEVLGVIGPSGSGKTTLFNILVERPQLGNRGRWSGEVLLNGQKPHRGWQRDVGYVLQRDIFFSGLTVRQELEFAAALRLPRSYTSSEKAARLAEVVERLGLGDTLDTEIGSAVERGLSGGELKRLNIAVEIMSNPALLLLDEPLTGLDSSRAYSVLKSLSDLAVNQRRAVALSVHQPSSKLFRLISHLLILAPGGHRIYFGPAAAANAFFEDRGFPCPAHWNIADHYIECVSDESVTAQLLAPTAAGKEEAEAGLEVLGLDKHLVASQQSGRKTQSFSTQVRLLVWRGLVNAKTTYLSRTEWILVMTLAVIWGLLWWGVGSPGARSDHIDDIVSVTFFVAAQFSWGPAFQQLGNYPTERDVLVKERASEVYSLSAWFCAKNVCELPVATLQPACFLLVIWPMLGLPWQGIGEIYVCVLLNVWVSSAVSQAVSAYFF